MSWSCAFFNVAMGNGILAMLSIIWGRVLQRRNGRITSKTRRIITARSGALWPLLLVVNTSILYHHPDVMGWCIALGLPGGLVLVGRWLSYGTVGAMG